MKNTRPQRQGGGMSTERSQNVQDAFLNHVRKNKISVVIFLVNGVQLQGMITGFDSFSLLLKRDSRTQLIYKHAVSTVMPQSPVSLDRPRTDAGPDDHEEPAVHSEQGAT